MTPNKLSADALKFLRGSADTLRVKVSLVPLALLLVSSGFAQTLSVVSGDSQITLQSSYTFNPLVVIAKDSAGRPMQGVTVNWSVTGPGHLAPTNQTVTDVNGLAGVHFVGAWQWDGPGFTQSTITASTANSSVSMKAITSGFNISNGVEYIRAEVLTPGQGETVSAPAGGGSAFVDVKVTASATQGIQPVPNVAVRLVPDRSDGPSLACAEGTGLTGTNGIAHCLVVFSGPTGTERFSIEVGGGFRTFGPFSFEVKTPQAQTTVVRITGGDKQAALPGTALPIPLTARVENGAGQGLPGIAVTWQPIVTGSVALSNVVSTTGADGTITAFATLGSTVGPAQVRVRTAGGAEVVFNLTILQPASTGGSSAATRLTITGGNNQPGTVGLRLTSALTARVEDATGKPLSGVTVTWKPSPSVSLSSVVSVSDSNGLISAVATPTAAVAPVQVDLQAQGATPTPFGYAATTIQATFNITVGSGSGQNPPQVGSGSPGNISIVSGNGQTGPIGSALPVKLTARVEDSTGKVLPNTTVTWIPSASVMLSNQTSVSDGAGLVSATATPISNTSPLKVDVQTQGILPTPFGPAAGATITATFTMTIGNASPPVTPQSDGSTGYIAHIADGGGWITSITVVNILNVPQRITLTFYADSGQKWSLPVAGGSPLQQKSFDLQPNASGYFETAGTAGVVATGWAAVDGSVSGSSGVSASAIFRSRTSGRPDFEAVSAMGPAATKGVIVPFDNRNQFATGLALANAGALGVVPVTLRDDTGAIILSENITLPANAHLAFSLAQRYPSVVGRAGTIEIGASTAAVLGLRFSPGGSFTSSPPTPKP